MYLILKHSILTATILHFPNTSLSNDPVTMDRECVQNYSLYIFLTFVVPLLKAFVCLLRQIKFPFFKSSNSSLDSLSNWVVSWTSVRGCVLFWSLLKRETLLKGKDGGHQRDEIVSISASCCGHTDRWIHKWMNNSRTKSVVVGSEASYDWTSACICADW